MKTLNLIFRDEDVENFQRIKNGEKSIETRAGLPGYLEICKGDKLIISCANDTFTKHVNAMYHFKNIDDLIEKLGIEEIMPVGTTKLEAIAKWQSFPGYPQRIERYGIIAWRL